MYYARSANAAGERQLLADHLRNVAELAGGFAEAAGLPRALGEWAGLLHDLGKYSPEFQAHLLAGDRNFVEHAAHGAAIALAAGSVECAFAVAAHHTELDCFFELGQLRTRHEKTAGLPDGTSLAARAEEFFRLAQSDAGLDGQPPATGPGPRLTAELRTRMLLSCLVDADRLDAERWLNGWKQALRQTEPLAPAARLETTLAYVRALAAERAASSTPASAAVSAARAQVLASALERANDAPGFFSLTVPTGGGKTLATLAFALAHAAAHGQRRLVFVLPFLTIIEQNARVLRDALGESEETAGRVVLEHHSNVQSPPARSKQVPEPPDHPDDGQTPAEVRRRLLVENWDVPVVVTTTVQFFESLFAAHPTAVRKLHNVAGAVVVFDEAQTFPPGMLRPIVTMLRQLVEEYGCTVLFSTATQPALREAIYDKGEIAPLLPPESVREIMPEPAALFRELARVAVRWPAPPPTPMAEVATAMAEARQALAIVNTKAQARALFAALRTHDPTAIHLSTRMCAAHRRAALAEVRRRLKAEEPCLVASTQLVEAGVDVDFPAVWRAFGPLDAIAQAAGRCNREGRLPVGHVTVFHTEDGGLPGGAYRAGTKVTEAMVGAEGVPLDDPATFTGYFRRLYNVADLDQEKIMRRREALNFPQTAEVFRIVDKDTTGVLVPYGDGADWADRLLAGAELTRADLRQLQPYLVALYAPELEAALRRREVLLAEKTGVHVFRGRYDDALGLLLGDGALAD
ncbi:MAG: CRISPR-associated endonuclease Cas3'' [Dehalococcoidia bacterium]|nr:CRISPR-associated endonuclease Cas3'' [Dehalococcoidia bacterium]